MPDENTVAVKQKNPSKTDTHASSYEVAQAVQSYLEQLKNSSNEKQIAVGAAAGFVVGYVSGKLGRSVFKTIGLTVLLMHVCEKQGYLTIDWDKINEDTVNLTSNIKNRADSSSKSWISGAKRFFQEQFLTTGGFVAGAFLGLSTS